MTNGLYALLTPGSRPGPWQKQLVYISLVLGNCLNSLSGTTTVMAGLTDVCRGNQALMAEGMVKFGGAVGLGISLGPQLGNLVLRFAGGQGWRGYRAVFGFRAVFALFHALWVKTALPESLETGRRRPLQGRLPVNPLTFAELFTTTGMLLRFTVFNVLNVFTEGKCRVAIDQAWMRRDIGWGLTQVANWTVLLGLVSYLNIFLSRFLFASLGQRGFTHFAAAIGTLAMCLCGVMPTGWGFILHTLLWTPAINGAGGAMVKSLATAHAVRAGMGAGEYAGKFANLRSLTYVFAPIFYSRIYAAQAAKGRNGGVAYFAAALLGCAVPGLMHLSWRSSDMFLPPEETTGEAQKKKAPA